MLKLIISTKEKKRFQDLFKFLIENQCEIALFPEGLKFRNHEVNGIVYKNAFKEYPITKTKPLGKINPKIKLSEYFKNWQEWEERKDLIEIPIC